MPRSTAAMLSESLRVILLCLRLAASLPVVLSTAWGQSLTEEYAATAERISVATIRDVTMALSADDMEGRGTAQPGGMKAARYLADRFARIGLQPLGDAGTFLQAMTFQAIRMRADSSLQAGDQTLESAADFFYARPRYVQSEIIETQGDLVCVDSQTVLGRPGDGSPGAMLKGKIAVVVNGSPTVTELATYGVAGIIVAIDQPAAPPYVTDQGADDQVTLARPLAGMSGALPPVAYVTRSGAEKLFAKSRQSFIDTLVKARAGQPFYCELGQQAQMSLRLTVESRTSPNVIGWLEGADPALKDEAVIYSAHYDAYGKDQEGRVHPGAADNALGVAKMLAVAEALARSPHRPRRSVVFLAPTAEEIGLLGSRYWLEHPTWPVARLAANLNLDGIDTDTYGPLRAVVVVGLGHSDLDGTVMAVARELGLVPLPDLDVESRAFYRSDHYEFALRGVPTVYVFGLGIAPPPDGAEPKRGGVLGALASVGGNLVGLMEVKRRADDFLAQHYHQPSDVVRPEWDWQGVRTAAVFYLWAGMRIANADTMPQWRPESEFNRPRGTRPTSRGS
ncbi:MAG: M20/M25/M40 family metallo-hydrolase [Pirellulaceae bacterium]|nr:M20/M25/M40 family metallo-hydrolase [Pirellulaceae bacterium]